MRQLIICADDYAQDPAIDAACRELLAAARELRAAALGSEVGLHLDLTHGWAGRTRFASLGGLMLQAWLRVVDRAWVNAEICRQLDGFEQVWGRAPDFVDGHQHVLLLPVIREALLAEMKKRYGGLARRPWSESAGVAVAWGAGSVRRWRLQDFPAIPISSGFTPSMRRRLVIAGN